MASIQVVEEIKAIEGADKIEAFRINGWWVVDKKAAHQVGDKVVYCEVDSWIPTEVAPFLTKPEHFPKEFEGIKGERLRTVKLRGQLSQGLIIPLNIMGNEYYKDRSSRGLNNCWVKPLGESMIGATDEIGAEVSQYLGIKKWELQELKHADAKGMFPHFFPKTDQERIQNCYKEISAIDTRWYVEEKIEGQSHSAYFYNGEFGVCSRNLELKDSDNTFWNTARKYDLENKLRSLNRNLVIQSEQCGPGISGNIYNFTEYLLFTFDIYDIDNNRYLTTTERNKLIDELGLKQPPHKEILSKLGTLDELLSYAEQKSQLCDTLQEGFIFRAQQDQRATFKVVSNKYLLKQK